MREVLELQEPYKFRVKFGIDWIKNFKVNIEIKSMICKAVIKGIDNANYYSKEKLKS